MKTKNLWHMEHEGSELTKAKIFFNDIGIGNCNITPPINSDIYCVKSRDNQWAAFRIGTELPIVPFGRYRYMCGFDRGYCLVSVAGSEDMPLANRGTINSCGKEVIKPYTFSCIFDFYGKNVSCIKVLTLEGILMDIPIISLKLL